MNQYSSIIKKLQKFTSFKNIITDTSSTKCNIVNLVNRNKKINDIFIPSHPIAGSEVSGPEHGNKNLFKKPFKSLENKNNPPKKRATAPPLGDIAVGTNYIPNPNLIEIEGPEITIVFRKTPAKEALEYLISKTSYDYVWVNADPSFKAGINTSASKIDDPRLISLNIKNLEFAKAFNAILMASGLQAKLEGRIVYIGPNVRDTIFSERISKIYRLNQTGLNSEKASLNGALQVWKPILGSALTTVVVFIPVLMIDLPIGQLFRDIAVAISVSVIISVLVSLTLIPTMANFSLRKNDSNKDKIIRIPAIDNLSLRFRKVILNYIEWSLQSSKRGLTIIFSIIIISFIFVFSFIPPLDYLPDGNRNFVFARIIVPPGYNKEATLDIAKAMEKSAQPLWEKKIDVEGEKPKISRFFFVAYSGGAFAGATTENAKRVKEILPILTKPVRAQPGARAFAQQASLFGRSVGGSRSIRINITGPSLNDIRPIAQNLFKGIRKEFPPSEGHQVRSIPTLNNGVPQVIIKPNNLKLSEYGISAREFATVLDVYNDGLRVSEIPFEGRLIDMTLLSNKRNFNIFTLQRPEHITTPMFFWCNGLACIDGCFWPRQRNQRSG